jgi:hypothetical protein
LTRGLEFIVYISQYYVNYIQEVSGSREEKLGGARAWSRVVTIHVGVILEAGVVDGHHFEAMTAEVTEFDEEGHVGGAAVRRSEDGGAENYFEVALDALDPVFDHIFRDSFEYAVGFVRK